MFKEFTDAISQGDLQTIISTTMGQIILWVLCILLLLAILIFSGNKKSGKTKIKVLTFSAVAIALGTVLSTIEIIHLPQGGSVTLFSMLVISCIGYWYGLRQGLLCGFVYGLIQLIIAPWVVHPVQLLLEYPIAFSMLGLSGLFTKSENGLLKGVLIGAFGRFVCHFIAGIIFFAEYAAESGLDPIPYSAAYNGSYIGLEIFFTVVILIIPAFDKIMKQFKVIANKE